MDYGVVLEQGALGEWDFQFFGAFAGCAIKQEGTYLLYYQGSCCYHIADDTVAYRAIGVATSPDGINFTKHASNPVVSWAPNNGPEEGAMSCGVTADPGGDVVLYYAAGTEDSPTTITSDGRMTTSPDGLGFTDQGIVLDHTDPSLWGSGDEVGPVIAFREPEQWTVYYIPNGTAQGRKLGVAWGPARDQLTSSGPALDGANTIPAWGMAGAAKLDAGIYALFINDARIPRLDVRTVSTAAPDQLSAPVETYQFADFRQATVVLDADVNTWFMYYRNLDQNRYGVKLAPAGPPDTTPPTAPPNLTATPASHREIDLTWDPATDGETGIVQYKVFRDGLQLATVKGWSYRDTGLDELTTYNYQVAAINYHGTEGPLSAAQPVTTPSMPP